MHSITLLTSIFVTLCVAAPQAVTQNTGCTPQANLNVSIFNAGIVTERICTDNPGIIFSLKCSNDPAIAVVQNELVGALSGISRAVAGLIQTKGGVASLFESSSVPNLAHSCQGSVCVTIKDTLPDGPGWFAGIIANVIDGLNGLVVGNQDVARPWVGCGFALSATGGNPIDYSTGCFAPQGKEGEVPYCAPVAAPVPATNPVSNAQPAAGEPIQ